MDIEWAKDGESGLLYVVQVSWLFLYYLMHHSYSVHIKTQPQIILHKSPKW